MSPDGARIAAWDADRSATVLDAATGAEVHSFRMAPAGSKKSLAYSPDGRLLAGTGEDSTQIDIWDAQTLRPVARLTGHTGLVYSVAFSGDGLLLASASSDRTVRVWEVAAAKCVAVLTGHTDEVLTAAFHPDGKRLASAGRDRAIWLWDLSTGEEVARLEGHTNYVFSLAFSPDGATLVSGSGDGTVRIWDTQPPARAPSGPSRGRGPAARSRPAGGCVMAARRTTLPRSWLLSGPTLRLSEPLRQAALRAVLRRSGSTTCSPQATRPTRPDARDDRTTRSIAAARQCPGTWSGGRAGRV